MAARAKGRTPAGAPFRRIGVVGHTRYEGLEAALRTVHEFAAARELALLAEDRLAPWLPQAEPFEPGQIDLLITLGGDGTLLSGARLVAPYHTPVLGVNLGFLGFLTAIPPAELQRSLERLFAGDYWLDERFTLDTRVSDGQQRETNYVALNDAVLHKGGVARMIRIRIYVGEEREEVATYFADGIILATPTGSTAYSLSTGGPVVVPEVDCIIATPISPHTLALRPLVVPATTVVTVEVLDPSENVILTVDGQEGVALQAGDRLSVRRGEASVPLVRFAGQSFLSTLRRKLHWGIERGERER